MRAAISYQALYYGSLLLVCCRAISVIRPRSFLDALKVVWLIHRVKPYTAVFVPRLAALHRLSRDVQRRELRGDIVECGVYNGGSSALIASVCCTHSSARRHIWLFDSFEGLPPPTEKDGDKAKACGWWCHGDLELVARVYEKLRIPWELVHIIKGWFHETFPQVEVGEIALLHIDADWYDSVKLCLERFYDHVSPGGYVVIDDYGHWEGCRHAVDEFLNGRGIDVPLTVVDYTGRYFQKPVGPIADSSSICGHSASMES
jgi:O-methyltransferase